MYTVTIIEDEKGAFEAIQFKVNLYPGVEVSAITKTADYFFQDYINELQKSQTDIFIVDWELSFKDRPNVTLKDIFTELKSYQFTEKFWIFYSRKRGSEFIDFIEAFLPTNRCYSFHSKSNIVGEIPKSGRLYLEEALKVAALFVDQIKIPNSVFNSPFKNEVVLDIPKGNCFDIDQYYIEYDSVYEKKIVDNTKSRFPKELRPRIYGSHVVALAFNSGVGVMIGYQKDKLYQYILSFDSAQWLKTMLELSSATGLEYNPFFFDRLINLKEEYRDHIQLKTQTLLQVYNRREKYKRVIDIEKPIQILKNHLLIK